MIPERSQRFEVALQRHQIETATEFVFVMNAVERQEVRDEIVELPLRDVDVRVAQQRHEIVSIRAEPGILEIDDVEVAVVQHQVAAVIIAVAQHSRLRRQLADDRPPFFGQRRLLGCAKGNAAIRHDEVAHEVLQLPRQLLEVERHPVRDIAV